MTKANVMVAAGGLLLIAAILSFSGPKRPVWSGTGVAPAAPALVQPQDSGAPADPTVDPDVWSLMGP